MFFRSWTSVWKTRKCMEISFQRRGAAFARTKSCETLLICVIIIFAVSSKTTSSNLLRKSLFERLMGCLLEKSMFIWNDRFKAWNDRFLGGFFLSTFWSCQPELNRILYWNWKLALCNLQADIHSLFVLRDLLFAIVFFWLQSAKNPLGPKGLNKWQLTGS